MRRHFAVVPDGGLDGGIGLSADAFRSRDRPGNCGNHLRSIGMLTHGKKLTVRARVGNALMLFVERKAFGLRLALQFRFGRNHLALTASLKLFDELPAEFEVNEAPFLVES